MNISKIICLMQWRWWIHVHWADNTLGIAGRYDLGVISEDYDSCMDMYVTEAGTLILV